ncbi:sphingomyelin phosphodiesterase-like [Oratosquilla oratoria]|uniref:sphingomyelin phosphodiesterase-like n=1 Tax=Oratosquilla oratoria TaxID=337810 RepID=UPI003F75EC2B
MEFTSWVSLVLLATVSVFAVPRSREKGAGLKPLKDFQHHLAAGPEDNEFYDRSKGNLPCLECASLVAVIKAEIALGTNYEVLVAQGVKGCIMAGSTSAYCAGYIPLIAPAIYYMLTHYDVNGRDICGELLNEQGCRPTQPWRDWSIRLQGQKPTPEDPPNPPENGPLLKVLHLADIHIDVLYKPGANANCGMPLCCREGVPAVPEDGAWYWGDYRFCGSPPWMLENMMEHINRQHPDIDYVIWTGDIVPHNMWSTSPEWNTNAVQALTNLIQKYFQDVFVYPAVGNHEANPLDQFPTIEHGLPDDISQKWLYTALKESWTKFLPETVTFWNENGAFYSVPVRPGFRIISINSMWGKTANTWVALNSTDPFSELSWLEGQLKKAEDEGELVHILGHVPPGLVSNERTWSREYNRIINRYENTIRGQFFGHTHFDEFEIFYEGERPTNIGYIAPSQTTWESFNPAYRIYYVDGDRPGTTRSVIDHETWIMNLTAAHVTNEPVWFKTYSAKDEYGMKDLRPKEWHNLVSRFASDRSLFDVYYKHYVKESPVNLAQGCDDLCYHMRICDMITSDRNILEDCYNFKSNMRKLTFD